MSPSRKSSARRDKGGAKPAHAGTGTKPGTASSQGKGGVARATAQPQSQGTIAPGAPITPLAAPGQYLVFPLAEETYAVSVLQTHEILDYEVPTYIPGAPPWVDGILNLRGNVVPLVDLATKFGATQRQRQDFACIIVVEIHIDDEESQVGMIVDRVPNVVDLTGDQIAEPPLFGTRVHVRYLSGMANLQGQLVLILDADSALTAEEVEMLGEIVDRQGPVEQHEAGEAR